MRGFSRSLPAFSSRLRDLDVGDGELFLLAARGLFLFLFVLDCGMVSVRGRDGGRDDSDGEETVEMRKKGAFLDYPLPLPPPIEMCTNFAP